MSVSAPPVSIAMATYNGEKYIAKQLESIVNQTYGNIEIVIADDHSTDNTVSIIREFQKKYSWIKLIVKDSNSGVSKTFEQAISNCNGEYIAISDQDDIWELNKIEILLNELKDEDAVYSNSLLVDGNGKSLNKEFKSLMNLQSYYSGAPFLLGNTLPGHSILMKANFAKRILPFPEKIMFDRWIVFCAAANNGIKYADSPLVKYRQHDANTFGTTMSTNRIEKLTGEQLFQKKLDELKAMTTAPVKDEETKILLKEMLSYFKREWSFRRSLFFFRNYKKMLVVKNKPLYRKLLYCLKMFFKPNY